MSGCSFAQSYTPQAAYAPTSLNIYQRIHSAEGSCSFWIRFIWNRINTFWVVSISCCCAAILLMESIVLMVMGEVAMVLNAIVIACCFSHYLSYVSAPNSQSHHRWYASAPISPIGTQSVPFSPASPRTHCPRAVNKTYYRRYKMFTHSNN